MKHLLMLILSCLVLTACQDSITLADKEAENAINANKKEKGMQRVIASSTDEIKYLISQLNEDDFMPSRVLLAPNLSNNEDEFVSLIEANRQKVMASLTPEQLDSIENDEDELEFYPTDSVIADLRFAQLLNADREIQVEKKVYKYLPNGVAVTDEEYADELKEIESLTSSIEVTPSNEGSVMKITPNVDFTAVRYQYYDPNDEPELIGGNSGGGGSNGKNTDETKDPTLAPIKLSDEISIPLEDIRDINYYDKGDGNWFHRHITNIWGRNVVAIKKFNKHKKLNMNFYDQNYIIYANIGTKLKMQKKVCGIWWNIKADEMIQGWETVTIRHAFKEKTLPMFTNPYNNQNEYPTHCWNPFPYGKDNVLLLTIPYADYDFTTSDLNKAFNAGFNIAWDKATSTVKSLINNDKDRAGLMSFSEKEAYIIYGPHYERKTNKRSMETKFYAKWLPGTYEFGFSLNSGFKLIKVKISGNDGVDLYRGRVYGAIRYRDKWLAARITKNSSRK